MGNRCEIYQALMNEFIDQELNPKDQQELEKHLQQCPACQKELKMLQLTINALHNLPCPPAPQEFLVKLRQRISAETKPIPIGILRRANHWLLAHPTMIAAGFVAVFFTAFILGRFSPLIKSPQAVQVSEMEPAQAWEGPVGYEHSPVEALKLEAVYDKTTAGKTRAPGLTPVAMVAPASPREERLEIESARATSSSQAIVALETSAKSQAQGEPFLQTPTQLIINLLRNDPEFQGAKIYPIKKGALVQSPNSVDRITISEQNFLNALKWIAEKKSLPKTIADAEKIFGLEIEKLPNPLQPNP